MDEQFAYGMSRDQFTADVLALLDEADGEAMRLRHEFIGTEHIVLALTARNVDVVSAALERAGVDSQKVYDSMNNIVRSGQAASPRELKRPFTTRTQQSFAFAAESAREMGRPRIAPEHLLLGVLREGMNIGAQVLSEYGLTIDRARQAIEQVTPPPGHD